MDIKEIKRAAEKSIEEEEFWKAVNKEKESIRNKGSFWRRVLPWKITIERR